MAKRDVTEDPPGMIYLGESDGEPAEISTHFLTRHGIIAGATGTGKSRAMQVLAEQLADAGVNVFVSDVKGDASGFCAEGEENKRNRLAPFEPHPIESNYWSVSDRFARMRFSISETGSVLFSRLLSLNPTQESHLTIAFSYARKKGLPLNTTEDLLDVLDELVSSNQRGISPSSVSVIQRKVLALEESGLGRMFGKPSISVQDLFGLNILNLSDARRDMSVSLAPAFLLQKLFDHLPEVGEVEKPEFVIFFDEAHYLFKDANRSLKDLMVTMLKQIRSKGVSVFFVTQDVTDIPDEILGQLSTKIIFSQKPMTKKGNTRLKALASSFPNPRPETYETIKSMPPGTALLSTLDRGGNQTEAAKVRVFAPATTMEVVPDSILRKVTDTDLIAKYARQEKERPKPKKVAAPAAIPQAKTAPRSKPMPEKRIKKVVIEKVVRKRGPSLLDSLLKGLLKLLRFLLKAGGMVFNAIIMKPLKSLFRYLTKKPVRLIYFFVLLLLIYAVAVNWALVQSFLDALKIS